MNKKELRKILQEEQLRPLKYLGQHFLLNEKILNQIVETADIKTNDVILEIGPGLGNLTEGLSKNSQEVIAIEKDKRLIAYLNNKFKSLSNIKIINADALKVEPPKLGLKNSGYKVVANIPYYLTSALLRKFLTVKAKPSLLVLLVQKEVARRIIAREPGLNILALSVQFFGQPKIIQVVSKENFWPKPKVDSVILKIEVRKSEPNIAIEKIFFKLIRAGFAKKRKTLINSLTLSLKIPKNKILELLKSVNINPQVRAQEIPLNWWIKLATKAKKSTL